MTKSTYSWEVVGASVQGASHKRSGLPNQDALAWQLFRSAEGKGTVLAVADGHGNAKSFRSGLGAKFAVQIATEILLDFARALGSQSNLAVVASSMQTDVPRKIVQGWQALVEEHHKGHAFGVSELDGISSDDRKKVETLPLVAYGTTLLAVLLTDRFVSYLQLGDGDILVVSEKGEVSRPVPPDERLFANETTSMCSLGTTGGRNLPTAGPTGAWVDFRTRLAPLLPTAPALIVVSTDGYANSFSTKADFERVGSDLLELLRSKGRVYVEGNLDSWLAEASKVGSGDDVTVGLIYRVDALNTASAGQAGEPTTTGKTAEEPEKLEVHIPGLARVAGPATGKTAEEPEKPSRLRRLRRLFW
jgi:hypothetical protein